MAIYETDKQDRLTGRVLNAEGGECIAAFKADGRTAADIAGIEQAFSNAERAINGAHEFAAKLRGQPKL